MGPATGGGSVTAGPLARHTPAGAAPRSVTRVNVPPANRNTPALLPTQIPSLSPIAEDACVFGVTTIGCIAVGTTNTATLCWITGAPDSSNPAMYGRRLPAR